MYVERKIGSSFSQVFALFPACVLTDVQPAGKSPFLRQELDAYATFDDSLLREFARSDSKGFMNQHLTEKETVLQEIQYLSDLLPYIKMDVDNNRNLGRWVLIGAQQFHSESFTIGWSSCS